MQKTFTEKFGISVRPALTNILLISNAFIWYFYAFTILEEVINKVAMDYSTTLLLWSTHIAAITFSALAGASLVKRMKGRTPFLVFWMVLSIASSLALIAVNAADVLGVLLLSFLFGVSLGLGMPNCMGYYTSYINVEKRGCVGGIIMLISGLGIFLLGTTPIESITIRALILALWRTFGLVIFLLIKPMEQIMKKNGDFSFKFIFSQRSFILYLIPWIMFSLINNLSAPVQFGILGKDQVSFLAIIENGLVGVFAIIGGFLADSVGRKRMAITGFVMLGLGFSILGIYPKALFSWYFYTIVDGIAWGVLLVIFVVTIWGDLSYGTPSDGYYAVGVLPYFISKHLQLIIGEYIATIVPAYAIFSFAAFFLFLAVLPLMYAPETLPEKKIRERELKQYVEKAKKIKGKYA